MENIILFLAIFCVTATAAQVSLFRRWWQKLGLAASIAAITYGFYPTAIRYSSIDVQSWLADSAAMLDLSVVLVLEAVMMLLIALFMLREMYAKLKFPWSIILLLQYIPMVSAIAVLYYYQVQLYHTGLSLSFATIAIAYGSACALAILVLAYVIKLMIPLRVLRLELKLAMHAAQIALAIAISVLTARYNRYNSQIEANTTEFIVVALLFIAVGLFGYLRYQRSITSA